jgi:hypothetical protein
MAGEWARIAVKRKSGREAFHGADGPREFALVDFWRWSASDLVSNATRGVLAEYIVARALGVDDPDEVRTEWDAYDLVSPSGIKVEVKSTAFIQSWGQTGPSRPRFSIRESRPWDADTGRMATDLGRAADVYVFALLHHRDQDTLDPMDLDQWSFYVVSTKSLKEQKRGQKSISLPALERIAESMRFDEVAEAVELAMV